MKDTALMASRRFAPLFWTQFLGAFNDNLFKNALVMLITFKSMTISDLPLSQMVAICSGLFILPFFLFSAMAGQLADKFSKSALIPWIKAAEVGVMSIAAVGFWLGSLPVLLAVLFLMGLQSTFFGPIKFGILPQLLGERELVRGNAFIEMGTFLAILFGTILAGVLAGFEHAAFYITLGVIGIALLGLVSSLAIPKMPAEAPTLRVRLNPVTPTLDLVRLTRKNRSVFLSILGISWFWFFAVSLMTLFPAYCKDVLHGNEQVITLLLTLFSIGIATGSLLCEKLSFGKIELGLVPLGSIGMTIFGFDLFFAVPAASQELRGALAFVQAPGAWRVCVDLFMLSVFSGFYIVPLQTLIQHRSASAERSRVIAGNNVLSSFFMVLSSVFLIGLNWAGVSILQTFLTLTVMNAAIAIYIYTVIPEFFYRFLTWIASNTIYRVKVEGADLVPDEGPAVIVSNHVTYVDWILIAGAIRRPVRLVMHHSFLRIPLMGRLCKRVGVIPIASMKESPEILQQAMDRIAAELEAGQVVCIFPEGMLTRDGEICEFRRGIEQIVARTPAPVVPMALRGLWGSFFSHADGGPLRQPFRRFWSRVQIAVGAPVPAEAVVATLLQTQVAALRGDLR